MAYTREDDKILFTYETKELVGSFLERGFHLIDVPMKEDGTPSFYDYSRIFPFGDEQDEVSNERIAEIIDSAITDLQVALLKLTPMRMVELEKDITDTGKIVIPILDSQNYLVADIASLDKYMYEYIVDRALMLWFVGVGGAAVADNVVQSANALAGNISGIVRRMIQRLYRQTIPNPFDAHYIE